MFVDTALRAAALESKAWPFEEARKLLARVKKTGQKQVLFETGYGPSGLPPSAAAERFEWLIGLENSIRPMLRSFHWNDDPA